MSGEADYDLSGRWSGIFNYPSLFPPNTFEAAIRDSGGVITGLITLPRCDLFSTALFTPGPGVLTVNPMWCIKAARAARRAFGNVTRTTERFHESRRTLWLDQLRQDLRTGARSLRRYPVVALVAIFSLAAGIGATRS